MKAMFWVFAAFLTLSRLGAYFLGTDKAVPIRAPYSVETPAPVASVKAGPPSTPSVVEPGILRRRTMIPSEGGPIRLWIYTPEKPTGKKLPCVFVAPAGTPLIWGMDLGEGDVPEQLPYVRAGFAVIAYEIAGAVPEGTRSPQPNAVKAFLDAEGGIRNAQDAMDYAEKFLPELDKSRFFVAGHSSAGTLALQVAQHVARVKGCVAYAPVTDLEERVGVQAKILELRVPGLSKYVQRDSPKNQTDRLACPTLIFHARDDDNVSSGDSEGFVEQVRKINPKIALKLVPSGGHYESMIDQGIPAGIAFLKSL